MLEILIWFIYISLYKGILSFYKQYYGRWVEEGGWLLGKKMEGLGVRKKGKIA